MKHQSPIYGKTATEAFDRLLKIMNVLRKECPWDRKQSMESLRLLTIEEMYELADAILRNDMKDVQNELGDLFMHLVFYAKIAEEQESFTIIDSLNAVCDKLVIRHPHIYGDKLAITDEEVIANWEQIKLRSGSKSVLSGVPKSLPALVKAYRIQEKVAGVGFDWEDKKDIWAKVEEEIEEFKKEWYLVDEENIDKNKAETEFGDVLFSLINYARHLGINPENALERTNRKFIQRFKFVEKKALENNQNLYELGLENMNKYWDEAKSKGL